LNAGIDQEPRGKVILVVLELYIQVERTKREGVRLFGFNGIQKDQIGVSDMASG
jgi:hypothetical protein